MADTELTESTRFQSADSKHFKNTSMGKTLKLAGKLPREELKRTLPSLPRTVHTRTVPPLINHCPRSRNSGATGAFLSALCPRISGEAEQAPPSPGAAEQSSSRQRLSRHVSFQ